MEYFIKFIKYKFVLKVSKHFMYRKKSMFLICKIQSLISVVTGVEIN